VSNFAVIKESRSTVFIELVVSAKMLPHGDIVHQKVDSKPINDLMRDEAAETYLSDVS